MMDIQKLKHLASEADRQVTWSLVPFDLHKDEWETDVVNYIGAISPATITDLLNRLEKAEAQIAELAKQKLIYQFIMNRPDIDGYIEWVDCNKNYFDSCGDDMRRIVYAAPPAPVVGGRTMPRHEFAQMVNELRDVPAVQSKREKIVSILHAFNINPACGSVAE